MIKIKRAYSAPEKSDGLRILVDRLWPRGLSKEKVKIDEWIKDISPSDDLRNWYSHEVPKWPEFKKLYFIELESNEELISTIIEKQSGHIVTFVYAAKDELHNNAVALKEYIDNVEKKFIQ